VKHKLMVEEHSGEIIDTIPVET